MIDEEIQLRNIKQEQEKLLLLEQEKIQKHQEKQIRAAEQLKLKEKIRLKEIEELQQKYNDLSMKIDLYMRSQKTFNSCNSLNYKLSIKSINNYINLENNSQTASE